MRPLLRFAALALLCLPASRAAAAPSFDLGLRGGFASPADGRVRSAPSAGLKAGVSLEPRYNLTLSIDASNHALEYDRQRSIDVVTAAAGFELALDLLPVVPTVGMGPAWQYAAFRGGEAFDGTFAWYAELGLDARLWEHLLVGAHVRYLSAAFSATGFPSFTNVFLRVGWSL